LKRPGRFLARHVFRIGAAGRNALRLDGARDEGR
jgi:hypothetical protein